MTAMSQVGNNLQAISKDTRVALVAGPKTLQSLGPVARHLIVSLLDLPMPVTLICPANADLGTFPETLLQTIRYGPMRLPFVRGRSLEALADRLNGANVSLLHSLDADALALTRRLAGKVDVDYIAGIYSLSVKLRFLDERCRALLAASETIRRMLVESHSVAEDMVYLVRPGVHQVRNATCFIDPAHAVAIVAAGELNRFTPFAAALQVFALLQQGQRECVFFLVGNGRAERPLRRLAEKLGLMKNLTFVDRTGPEQLRGILKAADIFISPVSSPRVDIELLAAMAGGVPVLAAEGDAADFVIPERTALTFPSSSVEQLAARLKALLDDRAAARALAENALAHLREHHSPAKMAKRLVEIYHIVLSAARAEV